MLKKIVIAVGLLFGSLLAAWGASSTLSGLSPGGPIANTDLFYDVQTTGVGGVKVTGSQLLNYVFSNISGNCGASPTGVLTCSGLATNTMTSIAAGTNITTSGTVTNTTINVIATPTFTSITTTQAYVTGWLTAPGVNMQTASIVGNLTAATAQFTGAVTGTTAQFQTYNGATANLTSNLTGTTAQFSGLLTGTSAVFQTVTINNLTPTGPNCLQETGGVVQATNASCGSGAAGANTNVQFNNNSAFGGDGGFIYGSTSGQVGVKSAGGYGLSSLTSATTKTIDTMLYRDGAVSILALGDFATNTNPATFRVYNTTDNVSTNVAPTNYERGVFDWTTTPNVLTVGVQKGGSGSFRDLQIVDNGGIISFLGANGNISLTSGGNQTFFNSQGVFSGNIEILLSNNQDVSLHRVAAKVLGIGDGGANANGQFNWGGEARLATDFGSTASTTLAAVTATTVTLQSGRNYSFHAFLPFSTAASVGGIKAAFGGGATATNFIADGICSDGAAGITVTRVSAFTSTFVANTNTTTTPKCEIDGTFEASVGGTFLLLFAQNSASGASTVTRGAYMLVHDIP